LRSTGASRIAKSHFDKDGRYVDPDELRKKRKKRSINQPNAG
jgi:hypothetical protein